MVSPSHLKPARSINKCRAPSKMDDPQEEQLRLHFHQHVFSAVKKERTLWSVQDVAIESSCAALYSANSFVTIATTSSRFSRNIG
jgi:hypothetical protein